MSYGERVINKYLKNHHYKYKYRLIPKWLHGLHLDFYIPSLRLGIEFDGFQHFFPVPMGRGMAGDNLMLEDYQTYCNNDNRKNNLCKNKKINLLRIENYTRENLKVHYIVNLLVNGLRLCKELNKEHNYSYIICEPHHIEHFKFNKAMIQKALPIKNKQLWNQIKTYIKNQKYGLMKYMIIQMLGFTGLHTKDVFKLVPNDVFNDVFNDDGNIKETFRETYQSIGTRILVYMTPNIQKKLPLYTKYLQKHGIKSSWLFPNPKDPKNHVSFSQFSKFINKVAKHFKLNHFNIYSLRKTGGYELYKCTNLKTTTLFLNESDTLSTYEYLGYDGMNYFNKIMNKAFKNAF